MSMRFWTNTSCKEVQNNQKIIAKKKNHKPEAVPQKMRELAPSKHGGLEDSLVFQLGMATTATGRHSDDRRRWISGGER
jgi:hypothetical protein